MNAKEMLAINPPLVAWWSGIIGDPRFDQIMMILRAHSFEATLSPEQQVGVATFIASMENIVNADAPQTVYPKSGLKYDTEPKSRALKPETEKAK
jgi:hypothetical protein